MKTYHFVALAALAVMAWSMSSCVTTETRLPDGTVIRQTQPAVGTVETAAMIAAEIVAEK